MQCQICQTSDCFHAGSNGSALCLFLARKYRRIGGSDRRAHRRASAAEIGVDDLPEQLHLAAQAAAYPRRPEETIVLDEFLGRVERELIRRALARAKGNKAKAARLLGLTRPRLYRRMVQLGLEGKTKEE